MIFELKFLKLYYNNDNDEFDVCNVINFDSRKWVRLGSGSETIVSYRYKILENWLG